MAQPLPVGRIPIIDIQPRLDELGVTPKAFVGEVFPVSATCFREGHDALGVALLLTSPGGQTTRHVMTEISPGTDRYSVLVHTPTEGAWTFIIEAYSDDFGTWAHNAEIKIPAGIDVDLMLVMGHQLFERAATDAARSAPQRKLFAGIATTLADSTQDPVDRLAASLDGSVRDALRIAPVASLVTQSAPRTVSVERLAAGCGAWYEFFPRSEGAKQRKDGSWQSGTFASAASRLPAVAEMGFDVVYLPPIHPIGVTGRKGPNNTLTPGPHDPGSPWAIGASTGGHDAVHPDLGTMDDFVMFVDTAGRLGLEIALDLALQASPDHPWVTTHPEWFTRLPDGSIAFAENPPKKYQDIYPLNFDNDPVGIRAEVLRIVRFWIAAGVRIFRVDNPHTKPVDFWHWLITTVRAEYPDTVFLAEAFTRPAMMQTLAKVGFQQSYSYFTWRNTKAELTEFFTSISRDTAHFMRPNLFVNTPDILTEYLQFGGPAAFKVRAALAATASPLWGVYAGFELFESVARPGAEEYIDNEKFEYRPRDWAAAEKAGTSLAPFITTLNALRREHPALRQLRNIVIQHTDDDAIFAFSKHLDGQFTADGRADSVIVVANTDTHAARDSMLRLDMAALGLGHDDTFRVVDGLTGESHSWQRDTVVRLNPYENPVLVLSVDRKKS